MSLFIVRSCVPIIYLKVVHELLQMELESESTLDMIKLNLLILDVHWFV